MSYSYRFLEVKFIFAAPPILALAVVIGWSVSERYSITKFKSENDTLKLRLAAHASGSRSDASSSAQKSPSGLTKNIGPINLTKLTAEFLAVQRPGSKVAMMRLDQKFQSMKKEELISMLDEFDSLNSPTSWNDELKIKLLQQLFLKDPEPTMARYFDQLRGDEKVIQTLAIGMRAWSQNNPAKAAAWLDEQIAAGKFDNKSLDSKNDARNRFEGALIEVLVSTDPKAAAARLSALPEDERICTLLTNSSTLNRAESQIAFANFIRSELPDKDRMPTLASLASDLVNKDFWTRKVWYNYSYNDQRNDYTPITDFLTRIQATPEERLACVEKAVLDKISIFSFDWESINDEQIAITRAWVTEQAPSVADKMTGIALIGKIGFKHSTFAQAAEIARSYGDVSGKDEVLIAFLTTPTFRINEADARLYAEKIPDPDRRQRVLDGMKQVLDGTK